MGKLCLWCYVIFRRVFRLDSVRFGYFRVFRVFRLIPFLVMPREFRRGFKYCSPIDRAAACDMTVAVCNVTGGFETLSTLSTTSLQQRNYKTS